MAMHEQNTQSSFDFACPSMQPQSSRFGKENLFFAILPDREAVAACLDVQDRLKNRHLPFATPRPPERLHVSLYHVDQGMKIPDAVIFAACRAAGAIDACQFELGFDHVATFKSPVRNAIVLAGNGGRELLRQLHIRIGIEMHHIGESARIRPDFQPHVTLFYDSDTVPKTTLEKPVTITAREFVLLHHRPGESDYEELGRWPLPARG
jgi:2'-5' RNA ligase